MKRAEDTAQRWGWTLNKGGSLTGAVEGLKLTAKRIARLWDIVTKEVAGGCERNLL